MDFKIWRQAERVGIDPTLSVVVAGGGIALEEMYNQLHCDVGKGYLYNKSNPLFNFVIYHVIVITIPSPTRWEDLNPC